MAAEPARTTVGTPETAPPPVASGSAPAGSPPEVAPPAPGAGRPWDDAMVGASAGPPSREESHERGHAARREVPHERLADAGPEEGRPDPVELLLSQAGSRVPELLPIRHGRMAASPFAFLRGAALVMAADLAATARTGVDAQLCGDAHLANFGVYGSPERRLLFDVNDFDETLPGPFEWDLKRLVASIEVSAREHELKRKVRRSLTVGAVAAYREAMAEFAGQRLIDVWYAHIDAEKAAKSLARRDDLDARLTREAVQKARRRDQLRSVEKLTTVVDGRRVFVDDPPLVVRAPEMLSADEAALFEAGMDSLVVAYQATLQDDRQQLLHGYRLVDIARKVVGVGSVGTRAWVLLMQGQDADDCLLLQAKEAQASVLEQYVGASRYENHGERVVQGQRLMQAASDVLLGWRRVTGLDGVSRDFYVRQLRDWKGAVPVEELAPAGLLAYGRLCGWTLARAHARSGDRIAIAAYLGHGDGADEALADFAATYADRTERDHAGLTAAIDEGRVEARLGV
ncbi:DUF2252 domain-containing protein [Cellulomonas alba]|uniref:DUF2252 family protein n=1 Tax=Cellulomonas alba TaxID=3053467 RepID=A0ABT7SG87_9CELL|nr:DUF2252 family protein [Cellulomonas alba]MDM7855207.1 DUF2252 family protein [Cellulomonas alba]